MKEKLEQLQIIRFLAFGIIFVRHMEEWVHFPTVRGNMINGITFFFILSGLVNAYAMYGRKVELSCKEILKYMKKKIEKFYPLYFCTLLVCLFTSGYVEHLIKRDMAYVKQQTVFLIRDLLLVQSWFKDGYFSFNGVAWFLSTLILMCFVSIPVLYVFNKIVESKKMGIVGKLMIFAAIIILTLAVTVIYHFQMHGSNDEFWLYIFPFARLGEYVIGMGMGYIICLTKKYITKISKAGYVKRVFTFLELASLALWGGIMLIQAEPWKYRVVQWLIPNIILLFVFSMGRGYVSDIFRNRHLVFLCDVSFECFLLHIPVLCVVESVYKHIFPTLVGTAIPDTLALVISLMLTICLGNLIHNGLRHEQSLWGLVRYGNS